MHSEIALLSTIAVGLAYALAGGYVALRIGLPPLVGYLLAGIAVGPFTPGFVADRTLAPQLAEIGVILLMFGVGMHFSVRELWESRWVALPGAVAQVALATLMGVGVAHLWGWSLTSGLIFGMALSVASTVVLLRNLESRNLLTSADGRIAVGWLIVEDLITVLALVVLPTIASMEAGEPGTAADLSGSLILIAQTLGKLALFVGLMLLFGARLFPWILERIERAGSRELFIVAVAAIALGLAYGASHLFGLSFALGAFFAGIIVNQSDVSHRAAKDLQPVQDIFAALFFVSVGMLFDPRILIDAPIRVMVVLAIILIGKSLAAFVIVMLLRRGFATAVLVSAALAQIGEFSFILAALGRSLGLLDKMAQDLILAGALLSIALNPLAVSWALRLRGTGAAVAPTRRS
jgi:CPA2 family monovalent cation:H+ antiporter-2